MVYKNNNNKTKFAALIFGGLFLFLLFKFYKATSEVEKYKEKYEIESKLKENQFNEILKKYDSLKHFTDTNELIDSKKIDTLTSNSLKIKLNEENSDQNESLIKKEINKLNQLISSDSKKVTELNNKIYANKKILYKLQSLKSKKVKINSDKLSVLNINARGVKIISDKYSKPNNKKIQQIRVCFTVEANEFIRKGNQDFYIQVVNPRNQIISSDNTYLELNNVKLIYSAKVEAYYTQDDMDLCTYVNLEKDKIFKGNYIINIYNGYSKIGSTIFKTDNLSE
jgi:archaeosine-15-forming tRNA-guanine transglycosylase